MRKEEMMRANIKMVLSVALGLLILTGCQKAGELIKEKIQTPKVSLDDLAITGISAQKLDLLAKLAIDNPNPIGLSLAEMDYELELNNEPFLSGKSNEKMEVTASGKSHCKVPLSLKYDDLNRVYNSIRNQDEVPYRLKGQVKLDTPIGAIPVPYDVRGKLPVVKPPRINAVELKLNNISLQSAKLEMGLNIFNPNNFPLIISKADYNLKMSGKNFSSGEIGSANIPPGSEAEIKIPLSLDLVGMGNWAYNLLKSGSSDYELTYDARYQIKDWQVKHQEKKNGNLKIKK